MVLPRDISAGALLFVALFASLVGRGVAAGPYVCGVPNVHIRGGDLRSTMMACEAAERAIVFLEDQGLDVTTEVEVELVSRLEKGETDTMAGYFSKSKSKAVVLIYTEFLKFREWLRVSVNPEIYRALLAHEVAHIITAANFRVSKPSIQAQEYIAYVTTFGVLDTAQRELILERFPGDGFETEQQMNTTIYLCDPMRFGAEAYRHFVKQGKDADYFSLILSGRVLAD